MLTHIPSDVVVMGNVNPAAQFKNGMVESIKAETTRIMKECCSHKNFIISSSCDIFVASKWGNIDVF